MKSKLWILAEVAAVFIYAIVLWRAARSVSDVAAGAFPHSDHLAFALIVAGGVMLALACLRRLSGGHPASYQFRRAALLASAAGFAGYTLVALITLGAAALIGVVSLTFPQDSLDVVAGAAILLLLVLLSEALPEELLFRGWLSERLHGFGGPWFAVLGQAGLFTLFAVAVGAVASANDVGFIAAFGVVLGMLRTVTGTVWVPVGFHLAFMAAQQSSTPKWGLMASDEPQLVQVFLLTMIPFTLIIAVLFDRVKGVPRTTTLA